MQLPERKLGGEKYISTITFIYLFNRIWSCSGVWQCCLCNLLHTLHLLSLLFLSGPKCGKKRRVKKYFSPMSDFLGGFDTIDLAG